MFVPTLQMLGHLREFSKFFRVIIFLVAESFIQFRGDIGVHITLRALGCRCGGGAPHPLLLEEGLLLSDLGRETQTGLLAKNLVELGCCE